MDSTDEGPGFDETIGKELKLQHSTLIVHHIFH